MEALLEKRVTAIGYEMIQMDDGSLPVLTPLSQAAGRMMVQVAASLLQNDKGGKGILLGGVPGVPPAEVVIIGAGTLGTCAARAFLGIGATVYVLDRDLRRLQHVDTLLHGQAITMVSHDFNVRKVVKFADVLIGAVLVPGQRAPMVVTREMVQDDEAAQPDHRHVDRSGRLCGNQPAHDARVARRLWKRTSFTAAFRICPPVIARTATHAFNNAAWPYIQADHAPGH